MMWRKGNPRTLLVGMQTAAATVEGNMKNSVEFPQSTFVDESPPQCGDCILYCSQTIGKMCLIVSTEKPVSVNSIDWNS